MNQENDFIFKFPLMSSTYVYKGTACSGKKQDLEEPFQIRGSEGSLNGKSQSAWVSLTTRATLPSVPLALAGIHPILSLISLSL